MITIYPIPAPKRPAFQPRKECTHCFVLSKMVLPNGGYQIRQQCKFCGKASLAISHSAITAPDKLPLYDRDLYSKYYAQRDAQENNTAEFDSRWWAWYNEYLNSEIWRERRRLVLERAGNKCEACRTAIATEAHHLTYEHVGAEPLYDLVAVCKNCHAQIKEMKYHVV